MNAYLPCDQMTIFWLALLLPLTLLLGFAISRIRDIRLARIGGWLLAIGAVIAAERLTGNEPAGLRMLAIIGVLFYAMKAIVTVESQHAGEARLNSYRWLGFAAGWFGMRPAIFATLGNTPVTGAYELLRMGVARLFIGFGAMLLAWYCRYNLNGYLGQLSTLIIATLLLLIGLSFVLHFGILNIFAGCWRIAGVACNQLFIAPLYATSLSEFWGKRWNMAFSEMTATAVYRPLTATLGRQIAALAAFLFSGLLHELAISVPVKAGFGLPMAYFCLQGALVLLERRLKIQGRPIDENILLGRCWTIIWLVLPMPLLFHQYFLNGVIWPIIGIAGN